MKDIKIPTILGLTLLVAGVIGGVFLVQRINSFNTQASEEIAPQNITVSNITHDSFTVTWSTSQPTTGLIKWGENKNNLNNIVISNNEKDYTHYIEIKNLNSLTEYFFRIYSDSKNVSQNEEPMSISTGKEIAPKPVTELASGKIITQTGLEVGKALVYINISGGNTLSNITSNNGEWIIPMSNMRSKDLSNYLRIDKDDYLEIFVDAGPLGTAQAQIKAQDANPVPPIELGRESNFTDNTFEFRDDLPSSTLNNNEGQIRSSFDYLFD